MPNWAYNSVTISHTDPEMMEKFRQGVEECNLLETFIPIPAALVNTTAPSTETNEDLLRLYGSDNWYDWNCKNWGTKWDVSNGSFDLDEDKLSGSGYFETAWSPPIQAYENLKKLGFVIDATYTEESMAFAGRYQSISGDDYYEIDFDEENWREDIDDPEVLELLESEYESWLEFRENQNDESGE